LSLDELPQALNPARGWLATANNLVVDANYPHFLSADLENPGRAVRLADLLESKERFDAGDFVRFQRDTYSAQAERFVHCLLTVRPESEREQRALDILKGWDYRLETSRAAASIYQASRLRALRLLFDQHLGELADSYIGLGLTPLDGRSPYHDRSIVRLLEALEGEGTDIWLNGRSPADLLRQALAEALDLLRGELGDDMSRWTWGRLNQVHFAHPVGSVKPLNLIFNRGPYPVAGDGDTLLRALGVNEFPPRPADVVDALRFIADLSDWEKCRIVIPGGQSGHVASKHYADLIPLWLEGRFQPMPFARANVEAAAKERLELFPGH